jgi:ankyrin repeat protein
MSNFSNNYVFNYSQFLNEKKKSEHPSNYKAPKGSTRDKKLDRAQELLKQGKKKEAYSLRDKMEADVRKNPSWKNVPREDSKVNEAKNKKGGNLSKETLAKIRKVATKKNYSFSSLKQEYIKGLGAYYSSGSRPGMTAHQWAMARVNAASPSKSWANVKRTNK